MPGKEGGELGLGSATPIPQTGTGTEAVPAGFHTFAGTSTDTESTTDALKIGRVEMVEVPASEVEKEQEEEEDEDRASAEQDEGEGGEGGATDIDPELLQEFNDYLNDMEDDPGSPAHVDMDMDMDMDVVEDNDQDQVVLVDTTTITSADADAGDENPNKAEKSNDRDATIDPGPDDVDARVGTVTKAGGGQEEGEDLLANEPLVGSQGGESQERQRWTFEDFCRTGLRAGEEEESYEGPGEEVPWLMEYEEEGEEEVEY